MTSFTFVLCAGAIFLWTGAVENYGPIRGYFVATATVEVFGCHQPSLLPNSNFRCTVTVISGVSPQLSARVKGHKLITSRAAKGKVIADIVVRTTHHSRPRSYDSHSYYLTGDGYHRDPGGTEALMLIGVLLLAFVPLIFISRVISMGIDSWLSRRAAPPHR